MTLILSNNEIEAWTQSYLRAPCSASASPVDQEMERAAFADRVVLLLRERTQQQGLAMAMFDLLGSAEQCIRAGAQGMTAGYELRTAAIVIDVLRERVKQNKKWGECNYRDEPTPEFTVVEHEDHEVPILAHSSYLRELCQSAEAAGQCSWLHVILEEISEAREEEKLPEFRKELVQAAAVMLKWIDHVDRRLATPHTEEGG